ncbi:hypothetical protein [Hydrogenivirga sp. 128-5-R1-1]|uniref:hypothetical protein n=1 Tax=Hydrogenivirga sp. 128-5-R1-1 TaxID=392423 RepID=UPI00015EF6DE|nr:hypothetical protein [Hydrogenivirga sp. 128-5-R1-1]EDP74406.1 hypothetical protein HG1285_12907 [Hydrogenivirga sp. 128-5-R1-1]
MINLTGNNWNRLISTSSSKSSSFSKSYSYSGLLGKTLKDSQNAFSMFTGYMNPLSEQVMYAKPNQQVLNNLTRLNEIATQNWIRNYRPAVNTAVNQTITNLANRGILDSSVASKTLAGVSSNYLNNLANLQSQLEMERINKALNYPMQTLQLFGNLAQLFGNLSRVSKSSSMSRSTTSSTSYNPAPAVGLLSRFMGI